MSKLHRDNAGYVGCSYEETQDPFYSYNKLSLPLSKNDRTVVRDEVTFTVTVASVSGSNKYFIDGTQQATVSLLEGNVYTFDQSHSSNGTHPLKFSYTADGTWGGGIEYTLGVTTNGTPGQSGAYTKIIVPFGLHDLKYYCGNHPGMGGSANVSENTKAFTAARPILETSNAYGESGFTGSAVLTVGDPTSSTDNPFGTGNGHSVDFDGNDALRIAGGSIGTGDWTIEFWVKSSSYGLERMVSAKQDSYSSERTNLRSYNGQWEFYAGDHPAQSYSGTSISTNTWVHAAVVRDGTTISYYAAGSRLDTDTIDAAATTTLTEVDVAHGYGSEYFTGKISNVRVSNTARYSGTSYTTPSAAFTSDANTLLLAAHTSNVSTVEGTWSSGSMPGTALPGEDPFAANLVLAISGKNGFQDVSADIKGSGTNKAVTANGDATTSSSEGRYYGGGSLSLDGSGDYFTIPNSSDFAFGTGDYTVEFWIKTTDTAFNILDIDTGGGWSTVVVNNNAPLFWQTNRANSNLYAINTNSDLIDGNWHHVAYVRKDGVHTPFLDGKPIGNAGGYLDATDYTTSSGNLQIGRGANGDLNGYLQDIRIYKGVAKYQTPLPSGKYGHQSIVYRGNQTTKNVTGFEFRPDFVWIHDLDDSGGVQHNLFDSVRGAGKVLFLPQNSQEQTNHTYGYLSAFNSDGFTVTAGASHAFNVNKNNYRYIAWCWKAGGTAVSNTDGNGTAVSVSANTEYGFSIVKGNQDTGDMTWGHGLDQRPDFIILKVIDQNYAWWVWHKDLTNQTDRFLPLSNTNGENTNANFFANTAPTDSVVTTRAGGLWNSGDDFLAYCWHSVPGYSKFGVYDGTGGSITLDLGFKPQWLLVRSLSSQRDWMLWDAARTPSKGVEPPNLSAISDSTYATGVYTAVTFNDDGVTLMTSGSTPNMSASGEKYIYAAFAENSEEANRFKSNMVDQLNLDDFSGNSNDASNAGATWQTSVKKFYGGAAATNTKRRAMQITSDDFNVGTGDFTLEFWAYSTSSAQEGGVWPRFISTGTNATTSIQVGHIGSATGRIRYTHSDNSQYAHGPDVDFRNQWVHVAVVREAGEVSVYCNGSRGQTFTDNNAKTSTTMYISGYDANSGAMTGYIQDVKWYSNIAKYTSSFSPPERSVQGTARRYPSGVYVVS